MTLKAIVFLSRSPKVTPQEFKDYYENHHMPLAKKIAGSSFPTLHQRWYLVRNPRDPASIDPSNTNYLAKVYAGQADDFPWDVCVEMIFEDMQHWGAFQARLAEQGDRIAEDEKRFMDRSKVYVAEIEGPFVSTR
ncbi:EthD domain-containing protein [Aspergillus aculeatinus CBS 121060]|uniref:Uncharacterized protein n=1 Tax=Aspergillus aculeatinus CBS 121060 TaxID=1448322 RepID=A0ACD1HQ78_9EURO|nr:hypothetical protein BO66DRAFT_387525 [Aspergillus aculeatinus CBS 121060]RAH75691.1 hypothetical protein BO66DRAFT_387525 [Aspergillus aculeatinus CBS 121060]